MNEVLRRIYATGMTEDAEGHAVAALPTGVPYDTGAILYRLVREHACRRTLEIGLAYGLSTLAICQALQDLGGGSHTAIDPFEESHYRSIGLLNVRRAGLDHLLRYIAAPSYRALPQLAETRERFDLAFVDGAHWMDYALVDFFYIDRMLNVGGYVVFDDLWLARIRRAVSYVLSDRAYTLERVRSEVRRPFWRPIASTALRMLEDTLHADVRVVTIPQNIAVLRKTSEDTRSWRMKRRVLFGRPL